jgi:hypothetical protein
MSASDPPLPQAGIAERVAAARRELEARMSALGLTTAKGWRIIERVVDAGEGSAWVLLPLHSTLQPPEGLGMMVAIDAEGRLGT